MLSQSTNPAFGGAIDKISVSNGTISWPDNGWYEVQFARSYNTFSEGGQSASPGPGVYNVINHTTGERFDGVVVSAESTISDVSSGRNRTSTEGLRDSQTTSERLGGIRNSLQVTSGEENLQQDVGSAETRSSGGTPGGDVDEVDTQTTRTETTYPDTTPEDFRSDQRTSVGGGAVITLGASLISGPVGLATLGSIGVGAIGGAIIHGSVNSETVVTTNAIGSDGAVTRTESGDQRLNGNDPLSSTTTSETNFDSGRQVVAVTDNLTGDQRTIDTDQNGVTTVTVSENDTSAASSPRTNTTYDEDGVVTTTVTSPTGVTYGPDGITDAPHDSVAADVTPARTEPRVDPNERGSGTTDSGSTNSGDRSNETNNGRGNPHL